MAFQKYNSVENDLKGAGMKGRRYLRVQGNYKTLRCDNALKQRGGGGSG